MFRFQSSIVGCALVALLVGCQAEVSDESNELTDVAQSSLSSCSAPANGSGSVCNLGNGSLKFLVTLPSGQRYVEVFARQNGIQNVATNIVANATINANGTTTYSLVRAGYSVGDAIEYRFYSYLPNAPGVFTPGPIEWKWYSYVYANTGGGKAALAVTKDASLIRSSLCCGFVPDKNFGANSTVDVATYHHESRGLFGYSLGSVPAGATITKAELVIPAVTGAAADTGTVKLNRVNQSSSWQESTVTWNTTPAATYVADATLKQGIINRLDVTSSVATAVANAEGEVSFLLTPITNNLFIDSKEKTSGQPTQLYVEWQ